MCVRVCVCVCSVMVTFEESDLSGLGRWGGGGEGWDGFGERAAQDRAPHTPLGEGGYVVWLDPFEQAR